MPAPLRIGVFLALSTTLLVAIFRLSITPVPQEANATAASTLHEAVLDSTVETPRVARLSRIAPGSETITDTATVLPPGPGSPTARTDTPHEQGVIRETYIRVDIPLSVLAARDIDHRPLAGFSIPVFDDQDLDVEIIQHSVYEEGSGAVVGRVLDKPDSIVVLGYDGEAESGTVRIPRDNLLIAISYAGDGVLRLTQLDPLNMPGCGL